jgi:hypothetical protein
MLTAQVSERAWINGASCNDLESFNQLIQPAVCLST